MVVGTYHFHLHGPSGQRGPSPRYKHEEHSGGYKPGSYGYEAVRDCCFKKHGKWWYITKETIGWFVSGCIDFSWEIADWSKSRISKSIIESWNLKDTLCCLSLCRDSKCLPHCLDSFTKDFKFRMAVLGPRVTALRPSYLAKRERFGSLHAYNLYSSAKPMLHSTVLVG